MKTKLALDEFVKHMKLVLRKFLQAGMETY